MRRALATLLAALPLGAASAADWPQWGGPGRDFEVAVSGLADAWPDGGPPLLWERPLGEGYSSVAVALGRGYTLYREGEQEVAVAFDPATGKTLWEQRWPAPTAKLNLEYGPGPHSTPLVVEGRVFAVGALGRLVALDADSGAPIWSQELVEGLGGTFIDRGYSPSPIAFRDLVIVPVGGAGRAVVAFRREDGSRAWSAGDFDASPASPLLIDVGGRPQLVVFMAREIAGLDPVAGRVLWSHPHETEWDLNISTPVWGEDGVLFFSSAYDAGSGALRLRPEGEATRAEPLWYTNQMRIHFTNGIRLGDYLVGSSGDFGPVPITAIDLASGAILWRDRTFSRASLIAADGKLVILDEDGTLGLARASREGLEVLAQHQVLDGRAWTAPTLVGRLLLVRDRETLRAIELPAVR